MERVPPRQPPEESYTKDDIARIEAEAARYGIEILPENDRSGRATVLTAYWPELGWECAAMGGVNTFTVNVTKQETFGRTKELLDEFLTWFSGPRFHIGTDGHPTGGTQKSWALTAQGVEPGGTVERGGFQFARPDEDGPHALLADGQTIRVDAAAEAVGLLTTGALGPASGTGRVAYTHGTSEEFRISDPTTTSETGPGSTGRPTSTSTRSRPIRPARSRRSPFPVPTRRQVPPRRVLARPPLANGVW